MRGISWVAYDILAFQEGICSMELVSTWGVVECQNTVEELCILKCGKDIVIFFGGGCVLLRSQQKLIAYAPVRRGGGGEAFAYPSNIFHPRPVFGRWPAWNLCLLIWRSYITYVISRGFRLPWEGNTDTVFVFPCFPSRLTFGFVFSSPFFLSLCVYVCAFCKSNSSLGNFQLWMTEQPAP
jgi:hypothetical protein